MSDPDGHEMLARIDLDARGCGQAVVNGDVLPIVARDLVRGRRLALEAVIHRARRAGVPASVTATTPGETVELFVDANGSVRLADAGPLEDAKASLALEAVSVVAAAGRRTEAGLIVPPPPSSTRSTSALGERRWSRAVRHGLLVGALTAVATGAAFAAGQSFAQKSAEIAMTPIAAGAAPSDAPSAAQAVAAPSGLRATARAGDGNGSVVVSLTVRGSGDVPVTVTAGQTSSTFTVHLGATGSTQVDRRIEGLSDGSVSWSVTAAGLTVGGRTATR